MTYILMAVISLLWGSSYLGTKVLLNTMVPLEILAIRWTLAFLSFSLLIFFKIIRVNYTGKPVKVLVLAAALQPCIYSIFETWGVKYTTASESAIFIATIPFSTVLVSWLVYKQKPSLKIVIAMIISFSGALICIIFSPAFSTGSKLFGYVLLLGAVITAGVYNSIFFNKFNAHFSPVEITYAMAAGGTVFFNALSLLQKNGLKAYGVMLTDSKTFAAVIFLGVGCSCAAYMIHNYNLSRINASISVTIQTNAITLVGVVTGIVLGGELWGAYTVIGLIMLITGIFISSAENKKAHPVSQ